ncbi:MAG TPA: lysine 2,3-aminomutase [Terriglobia bacterium]|nr:lysine 2,3-aminomutase [Terriglobia bacterium]
MLTQPRSREQINQWRHATAEQWADWKWQLKNRIDNAAMLAEVFPLTADEAAAARNSAQMFRLGITPHYSTLVDPDDPACPIRLQVMPRSAEMSVAPYEMSDPLHEDVDSPVPGLTHRYPDRVLLVITHECALYCRYCTRRRIVGDHEGNDPKLLLAALEYIRQHTEIRDVLISGGDPLGLSDAVLENVISRLRSIKHVEIIRIGTRIPVVMPQRLTPALLAMLRKYHPIWLNTHFNHPFELRPQETRDAMERLVDAGIPTGNQTVLLRGVNDCPVIMRSLVHELVKLRCRPYYIYNCDLSEGLSHFRTPVSTGLAIMESLYGHTSGYAVPTFVVDAPGGGGKIPLMPNYMIASGNGNVILRNYRGEYSTYVDHGGTQQMPEEAGCSLCQTSHEAIKYGPAAELWHRTGAQAAPKKGNAPEISLVTLT